MSQPERNRDRDDNPDNNTKKRHTRANHDPDDRYEHLDEYERPTKQQKSTKTPGLGQTLHNYRRIDEISENITQNLPQTLQARHIATKSRSSSASEATTNRNTPAASRSQSQSSSAATAPARPPKIKNPHARAGPLRYKTNTATKQENQDQFATNSSDDSSIGEASNHPRQSRKQTPTRHTSHKLDPVPLVTNIEHQVQNLRISQRTSNAIHTQVATGSNTTNATVQPNNVTLDEFLI